MSELYVYYKLQPSQAEAALEAFHAVPATGVRLLQRVDHGDPAMLTWMEIYGADVTNSAALERQVALALAPFLTGARHVETFERL